MEDFTSGTSVIDSDLANFIPDDYEIYADCNFRYRFSRGFSSYVMTATYLPNGRRHVLIADLINQSFIDLTAVRQGSGFSDPILNESVIGFLVELDAAGSPLRWGSDRIVVEANVGVNDNDAYIINLSSPEVIQETFDRAEQVPNLMSVSAWGPNDGNWEMPSPGGRWVAYHLGFASPREGIRRLDNSSPVRSFHCVSGPGSADLLGWIDEDTAVVTGSNTAFVLTLDDAGTVSCGDPLIPESPRSLTEIYLSFDRTTLNFSVQNEQGEEEWWLVPITGGEPQENQPDPQEFVDGMQYYWPSLAGEG